MLNSHMKSHTNVYQYRCANCTYATKYCHSLKQHLKKYNHDPATVLNSDGSLPEHDNSAELLNVKRPSACPPFTAMKWPHAIPSVLSEPQQTCPLPMPMTHAPLIPSPPAILKSCSLGLPASLTAWPPIPRMLPLGATESSQILTLDFKWPCQLCNFQGDVQEMLIVHLVQEHMPHSKESMLLQFLEQRHQQPYMSSPTSSNLESFNKAESSSATFPPAPSASHVISSLHHKSVDLSEALDLTSRRNPCASFLAAGSEPTKIAPLRSKEARTNSVIDKACLNDNQKRVKYRSRLGSLYEGG